MNSLNIVSRLTTTPPPSPPRSRTSSAQAETPDSSGRNSSEAAALDVGSIAEKLSTGGKGRSNGQDAPVQREEEADEKTALLAEGEGAGFKEAPGSRLWAIPKRMGQAVIHGVQVVFTTLTAPGRYVIACFYDERGHFSAVLPLRNFKNLMLRRRRRSTAQAVGLGGAPEPDEKKSRQSHRASSRRSASVDSNGSSSTFASDAEREGEKPDDSPARHTRSRTAAAQQPTSDPPPQKRSMKVKLQSNDEVLRKRRAAAARQHHQKNKSSPSTHPTNLDDVAQALKSPSSPNTHDTKLTRYPRAPAPPRPLVPRRQPSYTLSYSPDTPKKTLIIDLDETLIHSMAKGGRMSTGHMVEVRLGGFVPTPTSPTHTTPQPPPPQFGNGVPILYYVHERPGCHDFLRKVSKWYNLVVFTASVQEYADPVIDWLERERRYFGGRYYRQHCTLRNGAYIKDLAQVEPDLSRVMILDNSPMSYIFHEDNAIPIEGWISDPTDNDLIHLVPLLEGLQYVTDVRALLALRQGQAQQA
ncbi:Nuclear envelope morphology protein 1 [Extremus antarcticus]|uniref:Nuclear envelope morphology protein 1 n=1 Tax=Extremus antarcticus TaxID=702011 RepID=A0AAJ0DR67_9PEZI|nr:Nuclear envelope morphology protein 1 [Extremus antarcticus]